MPASRTPNRLLRAARGSRSQAEVADAANAAILCATRRAGALTSKYISDLERGRYTWPGKVIRDALCHVLDVADPGALGFVYPRKTAVYCTSGTIPFTSTAIDDRTIALLGEQTDHLRQLDRRVGARVLQEQMTAHVRGLDGLLACTTSLARRGKLARVLADAAALAGWQAVDAGAMDRAWYAYELARRAASEAESPELRAHAMGEQAYAFVEADRPADAVELVAEARHDERQLPRMLRCWLAAAHAEVLAIADDAPSARAALHEAERLLPPSADETLPYLSLDESHLARWQGNVLCRLGDSSGVAPSMTALESVDGSFVRARAGVLVDLAEACARRGEDAQALAYGSVSRHLAEQIGSIRLRRRVDRVLTGLAT